MTPSPLDRRVDLVNLAVSSQPQLVAQSRPAGLGQKWALRSAVCQVWHRLLDEAV